MITDTKKFSELEAGKGFYYEYGRPPAIFCHLFLKLKEIVEESKDASKQYNSWNCCCQMLDWVPPDAMVEVESEPIYCDVRRVDVT